jgi:TPR repeat protein
LGACYRFGRGTEVNQSLAAYYTEQAAKYGDARSLEAVKRMRK